MDPEWLRKKAEEEDQCESVAAGCPMVDFTDKFLECCDCGGKLELSAATILTCDNCGVSFQVGPAFSLERLEQTDSVFPNGVFSAAFIALVFLAVFLFFLLRQ